MTAILLPPTVATAFGLAATWAHTHPFPDDPDRAPYPPDAWNLAVWHSTDHPTHIAGPFTTNDGSEGIDCECGAEFVNPEWMGLWGLS